LTDAGDCHEPAASVGRPRHASDVRVDGGDCGHDGGSGGDQAPHGGGETSHSFACFESLIDEGGGERAREPDPKDDRQAPDLIFQGHALPNQFLARDD
jgi:hypothetical protein